MLRNWLWQSVRDKRWLSNVGGEWRLVAVARSCNAADHVFKLCVGGVQGAVQRRGRVARAARRAC
eukprot:6647617-Lingulodinium_polyedra.AAC.1